MIVLNKNADEVMQVLRMAMSWGSTYGPHLSNEQWQDSREEMVRQFLATLEADDAVFVPDDLKTL